MNLGLESRFNILKQSPLDQVPPPSKGNAISRDRWVASRFNVQTTSDDGRLILWNTLRGSITAFKSEERAAVKALLTRKPFEARHEGLVSYLDKRGFLVREGTDEYQLFQLAFGVQQYRTDALELTLLASEDCNFRCDYCYEDFARGTMRADVREGVKRFVASRADSLRYLVIGWFGGEPLYGWKAIEDLAPYFRQLAQERGIRFHSHMTTNGYLLSGEVADKLLSWGVTHYQITIDGVPEDHDRKRPTREGGGTFSTIFSNLVAMRRRADDFQIDVRVNFDQKNKEGLEQFMDLLGDNFGGDSRFRLRLRPVGRWGGDNDSNLDVCGLPEATEISNHLTAEAHKRGLTSGDDVGRLNRLGCQVCYAARPYHFVVGAGGAVMKCTVDLDKNERNIVGQLGAEGDLVLDEGKLARWTQPAFAQDSGCQKCVVLPLCQGMSCPLIRIQNDCSPCIPSKSNLKQELIAADRARTGRSRKVMIHPPSPATAGVSAV